MDQIYLDLVTGAFSGAIYAGAVYLKNRQQGEPFDGSKFGSSVLVGAVVGLGVANLGQQITESVVSNAIMMAATMGLTGLTENILKTVYRYLTGK